MMNRRVKILGACALTLADNRRAVGRESSESERID